MGRTYLTSTCSCAGACIGNARLSVRFLFVWMKLVVIEQDDPEGYNHEWHDVEVECYVEVAPKLVPKDKTRVLLLFSCSWLRNEVEKE